MEKLIELLNECKWNSYRFYADWNNLICQKETDDYGDVHIAILTDYKLISKQFWFIKWLVENDKIDKKKLDETERRPMYITDDMFSLYKIDECVIMLLSISDTPIDDLIYYLK